MAIVPGMLALLGVLVQPWLIPFFFLPFGFLVAPFVGTFVTVIIYRRLDAKGHLLWLRKFLEKIHLKHIMAGFAGVVLLGGMLFYCGYVDFPSMNRTVPLVVKGLVENLEQQVSESHFYFLNGFIDSEYIWQARIPVQTWDSIRSQLNLMPVDLKKIPVEFINMSPHWWRFYLSNGMEAYSTANFPAGRGGDGLHVFAVWDPNQQIVRMWFKDNF